MLDQNKDGLTTMGIAEKSDISKTTTLKYLASLKAEGKIHYIEVGPAKLWRLNLSEETSKPHPISRTEGMGSLLRKFKESVGLEGSAVVDSEGLTICADLPWDVNPEKMGSLISRLIQIGERSAKMAGMDPLKEIIIEGEKGRVLARSEGNTLLVAFSKPDTPLGALKLETEEFSENINELVAKKL